MERVKALALAMVCGLLSGCVTFPIVGSYYYKEVLVGEADYNPFSGTSHVRVDGRMQKVHCEGDSYGTYVPLFTLRGAGQGGEAELSCSDGRVFKLQWASLSWSEGYGVGYDQRGERITLVYGMNEGEAENFLTNKLPVILKRSD